MADKLADKVDIVNGNLETIMKQQNAQRADNTRCNNNIAIIKRVLKNPGVMNLLTAQGVKDVASINVPEAEVEEVAEKTKKTSGASGGGGSTAGAAGGITVTSGATGSGSAPRKPKGVKTMVKVEQEVGKKQQIETPPPIANEPPNKKPKVDKQKDISLFDDSGDEEEEEQSDADEFGNPQPNPNVMFAQSDVGGRRVYGVMGTKNKAVLQGSFLMYDIQNAKNVHAFDEQLITHAVKVTMAHQKVLHMTHLAESRKLIVEGAVTFLQEILAEESKDCPQPTFLDRPIVPLGGSDLKEVFNETPEPLRSGLHKFCRECGLFKSVKHDVLAGALGEVLSRIAGDVALMRVKYPEATVDEGFVHGKFVPIG